MAKFSGKQSKYESKYPSIYGSHASMINEEATKKLQKKNGNKDWVVLEDDWGLYETEVFKLDSGGADPNRNDGRRYEAFLKRGKN